MASRDLLWQREGRREIGRNTLPGDKSPHAATAHTRPCTGLACLCMVHDCSEAPYLDLVVPPGGRNPPSIAGDVYRIDRLNLLVCGHEAADQKEADSYRQQNCGPSQRNAQPRSWRGSCALPSCLGACARSRGPCRRTFSPAQGHSKIFWRVFYPTIMEIAVADQREICSLKQSTRPVQPSASLAFLWC